MHIRTILPMTALVGTAVFTSAHAALEQKLTAADGEANDLFGQSVAIFGDTCVIGASGDDGENDEAYRRGSAYIFNRQADATWGETQRLTPSNADWQDQFGYAVSITNNYILVGAPFYYKDFQVGEVGAAYLFAQQNDGTWAEIANLIATDFDSDDEFGHSVGIDEGMAVVGSRRDDDNGDQSGSAYIFERQNDGSWIETEKLLASDGAPIDAFGISVAISGSTVLVGAYLNDDNGSGSGSAYLYQRQTDGSWSETQKLTAPDGATLDRFGYSVAISGDTALVGAIGSPCVYIYERQAGGIWSEIQKLTASDGDAVFSFGHSLSISGDTALVGNNYGSAYLYQRQADGSWSETAKLTASDGEPDDYFGISVGIDAETALVGASWDDDSGSTSGSAYIYPTTTPPTEGACCVCTGCEILTEEQCANLGGQYLAGISCDECPPPCLGDVTGDGQVGVNDLLTIIANWNACP